LNFDVDAPLAIAAAGVSIAGRVESGHEAVGEVAAFA